MSGRTRPVGRGEDNARWGDANRPGEGWISPIGTVRHAERAVRIISGSYEDGSYSFVTDQGFDDDSGICVLSIDELVVDRGEDEVRLTGPWPFVVLFGA